MKSKPIQFSCHSLDPVSVAAARKESTKTSLTIVATVALVVGMFFVQSCSSGAKAGPNGGDVVALNDGKTSAGQNFEMNRGWQAGKSHGPMWSEMGGHGMGMQRGGPGGMHH